MRIMYALALDCVTVMVQHRGFVEPEDKDVIEFDTLSGKLIVTRKKNLYCELLNNGRIGISGEATLVAISDIVVSEKSK